MNTSLSHAQSEWATGNGHRAAFIAFNGSSDDEIREYVENAWDCEADYETGQQAINHYHGYLNTARDAYRKMATRLSQIHDSLKTGHTVSQSFDGDLLFQAA